MKSEYKTLVEDVIGLVKARKALFFEETFSIQLKPSNLNFSQKNIPKVIQNEIIKKIPIQNEVKNETKAEPTPTPPKISINPKKKYLEKDCSIITSNDQFQDIHKLVAKIDPDFKLNTDSLDDNIAKKVANKWKYKLNAYPVTILTDTKDNDEIQFLKSIAKAIEIHFLEAKVVEIDPIEKENQWDEFLKSENIRLIIAVDDQIWKYKNLMSFFKEVPNKTLKMLGNVMFFQIPNLKLYFQNFKLKKSLWNAICQIIAKL